MLITYALTVDNNVDLSEVKTGQNVRNMDKFDPEASPVGEIGHFERCLAILSDVYEISRDFEQFRTARTSISYLSGS